MPALRFEIQLPMYPQWRNVELMRAAILNCIAAVFHDSNMGQSVSVVAGELLENAVKYGAWDGADESAEGVIALKVLGDRDGVTVKVSNPIGDDASSIDELFATLKLLNSYPNPREAYHARLRELADHPDRDTSRLGLARIGYESQAKLTAKAEAGVLSVVAECPPD